MRPRTIDEFVGQDHILGPGRLLRRAIAADQLSSLIFSGPPGTGKTTLARVIANSTKSRFASVNAVLSGVKELRQEVAAAEESRAMYGRRTILFVDEVHRWNKAQQDALLPWVENGTVVLIGATTENPFFEVNKALVSRSRVFLLKPLSEEELRGVLRSALADSERGYGKYDVTVTEDAREHLVKTAGGDARTLLNALELAVETTPERFPPAPGERVTIDLAIAEESIQQRAVLYDKEGDYHFDTISAFIKSLRGSDPDAALYWLGVMVAAGEDPRFIFRRMLISAAEDVGLADPNALTLVESAAAAFDRVGMPEGNFHLAEAALYLANAPKSNSTLGFFDALEQARGERAGEVPNHLKDANRDAKGFGHGAGYLYPHAYREHWVAQQYLPRSLQGVRFYQPGELGWEGERKPVLLRRREAQLAAHREITGEGEVLSFTPDSLEPRALWRHRSEEGVTRRLEELRDRILHGIEASPGALPRHGRVLFSGEPADLLLWELLRRVPEGELAVYPVSPAQQKRLAEESAQLPELRRPRIIETPEELREETPELTVLCNPPSELLPTLLERGVDTGAAKSLFFASRVPAAGTKLSDLLPEEVTGELRRILVAVEEELYRPTAEKLRRTLREHRLEIMQEELLERRESREITGEQLKHWLDPGHPGYGAELERRFSREAVAELRETLQKELPRGPVSWKRVDILFECGYTNTPSGRPD